MPLDNTASVQDIITSLQTMEGINAKADLASVVGSPATAGDTMATITNTIQQAKNDLADKTGQVNTEPLQSLVNNTVVGKKWASGETTSSPSTSSFQYLGSTSVTALSSLAVTGLDFKPAQIIIFNNVNYISTTVYRQGNDTFEDFAFVIESSTANGAARVLKAQFSPAYVDETGFLLPVLGTSISFSWMAYE